MTEETMKLLEKERQLDHDILVRYLRIQRIKRQMAEELNPFSEEFDRAAEQLKELMDAGKVHRSGKSSRPAHRP